MKIYLVGGYVRDSLLSREGFPVTPGDKDWVVVGSSPREMLSLGYLPVGQDFPVFLHPSTHEEYALARTERKIARGYHGFEFFTDPSVTLEEDLIRRDLTINAMAMEQDGTIIDPYGGQEDLSNRVLRHVSKAFSEDPVRILRVARFAARFFTFKVARSTTILLKKMVHNGEADALVPERVWAELAKGFMEARPDRMIEVLQKCELWSKLFPEIEKTSPNICALPQQPGFSELTLEERVAIFLQDASSAVALEERLTALRAPANVAKYAGLYRSIIEEPLPSTADEIAALFKKADALRHPDRFGSLLNTLAFATRNIEWLKLMPLFSAWSGINAGVIARAQSNPRNIPTAVAKARMEALINALNR